MPVLSYWFLRPPKAIQGVDPEEARRKAEEKEARSWLQRIYVPVLRFATRRRFTSLMIAVVVLVGTFGMAPLLKTNFFDQGEQEVLSIKQELKPGTSLAASDEAARKVEKVLQGIDEIKDYQGHRRLVRLHGGLRRRHRLEPGLVPGDAEGQGVVRGRRTASSAKLGKLSGIGTTTIAAGDGFGSQGPQRVVVKAADGDVLDKASEQVRDAVAKLDDVTDVCQRPVAVGPAGSRSGPNSKAAAAGFDDYEARRRRRPGACAAPPAARRSSTTPSATSW
ncbi:efflux RND transporter permease subunit [Streptomyces sp. KL116D]|uniref:efflux RND transporter permease subunit n=1 Tax=Streptomyces sp. KL116D TaxID=3045152 RepID=UPI0035570055